jgi:ACT domain-containing protein
MNKKNVTKGDNLKKTAFLAKYEASLGNITMSCKEAGVSRTTYYRWREDDENFRQSVDDIEEMSIDFAESALKKQIQDGDTTAIIFYLKTKGKKRGYTEKQEIDLNASANVKATVKKEDPDFDNLPDDVKMEIVRKIQDAKHEQYMKTHYGENYETDTIE